MSLYREEFLKRRVSPLEGSISVSQPLSWTVVTGVISTIVLTMLVYLATATYSRSEIARGELAPEGGVLQITPDRSGRVEQLSVREGEAVERGQKLAWVRSEQTGLTGRGSQAEIIDAIERQERSISGQTVLAQRLGSFEAGEYAARIEGLQTELQAIAAQIEAQRNLVEIAAGEFALATKIGERGFISRRELSRREEALLDRRQQLAVLGQTRAAKLAALGEARQSRLAAAERAQTASLDLDARQAAVSRDSLTSRAEQGYALVSPARGRVSAIAVHDGEWVTSQDIVMMVVPARGKMVARIFVPGKAVGFVRAGQAVRMSLDAYPIGRFGALQGKIREVAAVPVQRAVAGGEPMPFYLAVVDLPTPFVVAYGQRRSLLPGMTLDARIVIERRTFVQWMFDPLYASVTQ